MYNNVFCYISHFFYMSKKLNRSAFETNLYYIYVFHHYFTRCSRHPRCVSSPLPAGYHTARSRRRSTGRHTGSPTRHDTCTVKPVLAVTFIKQPTCLKQPNKMFPNVKFVLIFTSVKQPLDTCSLFVLLFVWSFSPFITLIRPYHSGQFYWPVFLVSPVRAYLPCTCNLWYFRQMTSSSNETTVTANDALNQTWCFVKYQLWHSDC